jgi:hypothetical protein
MAGSTENHLEEHLPYERTMMLHSFARLLNTRDQADWNAFLAAFCIYARNLKMFVTNDSGKGNNGVIARTFVTSFGKAVPKDLTGAFQRLNEQTTHLAKKRTADPKKKFNLSDAKDVLEWLEAAMTEFVEALKPVDKDRWNRVAKEKAKRFFIHNPGSPLTTSNAIQVLSYTMTFTMPPGWQLTGTAPAKPRNQK